MSKKFKSYMVMAMVSAVTVAVLNRVEFTRNIINP